MRNAIVDFVKYGNKEGLIMYASHVLALCDDDLAGISGALKEILKYTGTRRTWNPSEVEDTMRRDVELRQKIASGILVGLTCRSTKR